MVKDARGGADYDEKEIKGMDNKVFQIEIWNESLERDYQEASKAFREKGLNAPSRKSFYFRDETEFAILEVTEKSKSLDRINERWGEYEEMMKNSQAPVDASGDIILYFTPLSRVVEVGKQFTFELSLNNYRGRPFDEIHIKVYCDPSLIRFDSIDYKSYRGTFPFASVDKAFVSQDIGVAEFWGYSQDTNLVGSGAFCEITATALAPVGVTALDFMFGDNVKEADTAVKYRGYNILGMPGVKNDGTIRAFLTIQSPELKRTQIVRQEETGDIGNGESRQEIGISLEPAEMELKAGEIKSFAIRVDNPSRMKWDQVSLVLQFDPEVIQVLDVDRGNWISSGINIYDGDRHREFPFDFHAINLVDNKNGVIWYRNGSTAFPFESEGVLATCFFKAMQPGTVKIEPYISDDSEMKGTGVMMGRVLLTNETLLGNSVITVKPVSN